MKKTPKGQVTEMSSAQNIFRGNKKHNYHTAEKLFYMYTSKKIQYSQC